MNSTLQLILSVADVLVCLAMIVLVLLQNSKSEGLSAVSGSSETFFGMNKGRSLDAKLQKLTVGCAVVFFLLTAALALCRKSLKIFFHFTKFFFQKLH